MFGGTEPQRQQSESRNQVPITPEEEAIKRNTDCVYFLASPLTCKKGIECEYRHSDIARVNPRDCWYWLNGNCLNPKCAFRHPPLDGLLGTQLTVPSVNPSPPSQTVVPVASQGPIVPGKQAVPVPVPCIFFRKGYCLKGDMCPFMHASYHVHNKTTQSAEATPVNEPQTEKKTFGTLRKHTQEQKVSHANALKSTDAPAQVKSPTVVEKAPLRNEISVSRTVSIAAELDNEYPRYRPENVHSSSIGNSVSWSNHKNEVHMLEGQETLYVKDVGEVSREPSPGFDVLVDDELRDSEYYPDEDRYGRTIGHDGMDLNTADEYDIGRSAQYGSLAGVDQDMYHEGLHEQHGWEEQRSLSERRSGGSAHSERRRYPRADSPVQVDGSDLRHHLLKQKRNNGLRSAISRDRSRENHADDRSYRAPRRDHFPIQDVSSRLRGRIKIPGRSMLPVDKNDYRSEREIDRARHHNRLSSERPLGRLRDRIKGRAQEEYNSERNFRGSHTRSDLTYNDKTEFSGPKSLSELKVGKTSESYKLQINDPLPHGKRNYSKMEEVQNGEGDSSFEGPKPLSEILKRKRKGDVAFKSDSTNEYNYEGTEAKYAKVDQSHMNEESICASGEIGVAEDSNKLHEGKSSLRRNPSEVEREDGMMGDEAGDDQRGGGDFDYDEQADGEDYNLDEGENADPEYEYFDEDDADDFAKKMGVVYS